MNRITILYCAILLSLHFCARTQTIISIGNSNISKQEFLRAFSKNNNEQKASAKAYRDYLNLYIRFKLKVKAAQDLKMDTLPKLVAELQEYRSQVQQGYLYDESSFESLLKEAFSRSQKDIHLAHIFVAIDSATISQEPDTLKAWKQTMDIYNALEKGEDFSQLAYSSSSDLSARVNHGDIGYITVFTLPYALENLAYATPVGRFSKPYRSTTGYHIFKNLGERKAAGKMKAAQILFAFPPNSTDAEKQHIKQTSDSVYNILLTGASFNQMIGHFSNDLSSISAEGEMPEFGVGSFDPLFEAAVFALDKNNAITQPILTNVGYYIIKRLDKTPVNSDFENDSAISVLKEMVRNDTRIQVSKNAWMQKIYKVTGFRKTGLPENVVAAYSQNSLNNTKLPVWPAISDKTVLFTFPGKKIYVGDFTRQLRNGGVIQNNISIKNNLHHYEESVVQEYYQTHLEKYNPDFASQLNEFKEGNLLFEIMQQNIWDKASLDTLGLKAFYEKNRRSYLWETSADAIIFSCPDSATATELKGKLEKNINEWRNITAPYEGRIQADSGRFDITQLPLKSPQMPNAGVLTGPVNIPGDTNTSFVYMIKLYPAKQPRSFEDAKGFVLNDYQTYLEDQWVNRLKNKYPVKVNEAVFQSLLQ